MFIAFEGADFTGKTTQAIKLARELRGRTGGPMVVTTREPGGTPAAENIRAILLDAASHLDPYEELLLFNAMRHHHLRHVINPALQRGDVVISDRFALSSLAYQTWKNQTEHDIRMQHQHMSSDLRFKGLKTEPDLSIILTVPVEVAAERKAQREGESFVDSFESRGWDFWRHIDQTYRDYVAEGKSWTPEQIAGYNEGVRLAWPLGRAMLVDATGTPDEVHERVLRAVKSVTPIQIVGSECAPSH